LSIGLAAGLDESMRADSPRDDVPADASERFRANRTWGRMFADSVRGARVAICREANFAVHFAALAAVVTIGAWVGLSLERWCLLALAAAIVVAAEMGNTAIEHLARAVTREEHPEVRDALDVASAAVLAAAVGAAVVGVAVLGPPLVAALRG
jgi:diacylglycerol kinase